MSSHDCPDWNAHNDFKVWEGRSGRVFLLVSGSEAIDLLGRATSHNYVNYSIAEKKKLTELLCLVDVQISSFSIFIGKGLDIWRIRLAYFS